MALSAKLSKREFQFAFDARTSRGPMRNKTSWFIQVWDERDPRTIGIGECGPLPGLSIDAVPDFQEQLLRVVSRMHQFESPLDALLEVASIAPRHLPSAIFGAETALLDLCHGGRHVIQQNDFIAGQPIPINGLIWMGDAGFMRDQISSRIGKGFNCLKLKIGGLDFAVEVDVIDSIRKQFGEAVTIRLDANGSFNSRDALKKLDALSGFGIHSIEQPVMPGDAALPELCRQSPIPIALDEELITHLDYASREKLLSDARPQYIILKPSLHGGMSGCREWIALADSMNIGWWITSALESNIGLNAICQFTANYHVTIPQGLGTGSIYTNNISSPLHVQDGAIRYDPTMNWGEV